MKACVLYFSQTGNTKSFAQTISEALEAPAFDLSSASPSVVNDFDVIIIGTPVHGFNPSKEALAYAESLPDGNGKRSVVFCTCRLWKGSALKKLEKTLKNKNYKNVLCVSAKAKEFTKEDFAEPTGKIVKKLQD
ncbi:MAG: flavodoxin family protein [Candidatus Bathyarchaeia archaeon]|jgi:flavodoxin